MMDRERHPDALDQALDRELARRFGPPADLEGLGARLLADARPRPGGTAPFSRSLWPVLAAAAALVAIAWLGFGAFEPAQPAVEPGPEVALETGDPPVGDSELPVASGLVPRSPFPAAIQVPDLAAILADFAPDAPREVSPPQIGTCTPFPDSWVDPGTGVDPSVADRLAARYDECLDVQPTNCALYGPYPTPNWPSATVFLGVCSGVESEPSMLVFDNQTLLGCGLNPRLDGLEPSYNSFYKEINGLAVWELSTGPEPRLLDAVQACMPQ